MGRAVAPLVKGNIADELLVRRTIERYDLRAAIYLAASAYVGESMSDPRKYFQNNVNNSLKLLDALLAAASEALPLPQSIRLAVRVRFELTEPVKVQRFSRPPHSTTLPPHRLELIPRYQDPDFTSPERSRKSAEPQ
jgi:hypothetical protein